MSDPLDDRAALERFDPGGMLGAIAGLPAQLTAAWSKTRELELPAGIGDVTAVAVLGMGGSAIGADLVRAIFADRLRVPLIVVRDYTLPAFAGPTTLVVAASHSGRTEETLSAMEQAARRGCRLAVVTGGGELMAVARRARLPLVAFPGDGQPRAAAGWSTILLAGLLERAGLLDLKVSEIAAAEEATVAMVRRCGPDTPTERNRAKQLAWSIIDRLPIVEAGGVLGPVARRWKTQLNENGKTSAVFEELPEATHNAVVGYAQPESLRDRLYVVFLVSPDDDPRIARRAALSMELLRRHGIAHEVVTAVGDGSLAQAFSTIAMGDLASAYLAVLYGTDPTAVGAITWLKERLAAERGAGGTETVAGAGGAGGALPS